MVKERFIELIDKYLSGTANHIEQQLVEEYLARLEENDNTTPVKEQDDQKLKEEMWQQIQLQTKPATAQVVQMPWYKRKGVRSIAVAASVIMVIGLGILLFINNKPNQQTIAVQKDKRTDSSSLFFVKHEINTTGKEKRISLPDGSSIELADKSEITYRQPFTNSRDISLIGKAWFKVAKDKARPFTVTTGDIATTALGTEFTVTAFKSARHITVRLYEGKVVVKAVDKGNKRMKNDVYLLPGQELIYGGPTVKVRTFRTNRRAAPEQIMNEELSGDNPSIPENTNASYFMFNNQSLAKVLDDLAALYQVKIVYYKKDLKNIYFTGKYNRADSLEPILKRIGTLNNLTITKKDNAFIISK
ncbi:MAG: FecR family protein [Segetibacter sp.]|nr:FecR family protein [Segetibacter sp.]